MTGLPTTDELTAQDAADGIQQQVVGAVIQDGERALLLRRPVDDFRGGTWELPSGKVDGGENLDDALAREVAEETGLTVANVSAYLGAFEYTSGSGKRTRQHTWMVAVEPGDVHLTEHDEYAWALSGEKPVSEEVLKVLAQVPLSGVNSTAVRHGRLVDSRSWAGRRVEVIIGDLTKVDVDAIVCPANSYGTMGGGVAAAILRAGGLRVESEAVRQAPIPLGTAVLTTGGDLSARQVIHAPTMYEPVEDATVLNVRRAMDAALAQCDEHGIAEVAFPGMGTGVGKMSYEVAAEVMLAAVEAHAERRFPESITLVATNEGLADAWLAALSR
jgi:8-oxo-dGTP diphosphatase